MTCTICEADVVLSTWTFDEDGNIQSQDECKNSGYFVGEEDFCKCFDVSNDEWKSICHTNNSDSKTTIVCLCSKCGHVVNKLKSLCEQLNRIQMELSAVKGTFLMEIVNPSQLTHLNNMKNSPFRQFMKTRFSPGINTKDLDIKGRDLRINKDKSTNYSENVEEDLGLDLDMEFPPDFEPHEPMSEQSLYDENENEDEAEDKREKRKSKRSKSTKKKVSKNEMTNINSETTKYATVEISPGIFRFREKWDFEKVGEGLKVKCLSCQQIFPRRAKVIFHIMKKHNLEKFRCVRCKKSWKDQSLLDTHNCRPRPIIRNFKTKVLPDGKTVIYDGQWEYTKIDDTLDLYQCGVCSVTKRGKKVMNTHIKERHIDPARHVCDQCGRAFGSKKHFLCHLELHSNEHYVCDECGHVAKTRAILYLHKQTHSTWLCPYCQHTYSRKRGLKVHVETYHTAELASDLDSGNLPSLLSKILLPPPVINNVENLDDGTGRGGQKIRRSKISHEPPVFCPNCRRKYATSKTLAVHLDTCRITELVCPEIECAGRAAFESYEPFHAHMYRHRKQKEKQQQMENSQQSQ